MTAWGGTYLEDTAIMAHLNYAYVHAVAAETGLLCSQPGDDRDSVDAIVTARGLCVPDSISESPSVDLQLKATMADEPLDNVIRFDLKVKNYNDLRRRSLLPRYLVVMTMPTDRMQWVAHDEAALLTRRCAYWTSLYGKPATTNTATVRIEIPRVNRLDNTSLRTLLTLASKFQRIDHTGAIVAFGGG